jgi:hypothetical protein
MAKADFVLHAHHEWRIAPSTFCTLLNFATSHLPGPLINGPSIPLSSVGSSFSGDRLQALVFFVIDNGQIGGVDFGLSLFKRFKF